MFTLRIAFWKSIGSDSLIRANLIPITHRPVTLGLNQRVRGREGNLTEEGLVEERNLTEEKLAKKRDLTEEINRKEKERRRDNQFANKPDRCLAKSYTKVATGL